MGILLLEGGAEFGGDMRVPDLKAIELAGGFEAPIRIIPAAAAPDRNDERAGNNGVRWFERLGAENVLAVPVIDRTSANDEQLAAAFRDAKLIYLLGGFTHHLAESLRDSLVWQAVLDAYQNEAVVAGSSAGAMVLCQFYYDPGQERVYPGLGLVPNALVIPHHNTFGKDWAPRLVNELSMVTLIGIDEQTGILNNGANRWSVHGAGAVTLYFNGRKAIVDHGDRFSL